MRAIVLAGLLLMILLSSPAHASEGPSFEGSGGSDAFEIVGEAADNGEEHSGSNGEAASTQASPHVAYAWASVCVAGPSTGDTATVVDCPAARACADPAERMWRLWGRAPESGWTPLGTQCFGRPPGPGDTPRPPEIGPGDVLTALRRIGLPALEAKTQPADKTLVNFETIFYAEPQTFARTLTLLGQRVEVEATPTAYTWHHGDGTSTQTSTPGARYPAKEVVHEYTDAQVTVSPSVDVTYSARFRVNGSAWQEIPETVTISGPQGSLRIAEATAVLSGQYD